MQLLDPRTKKRKEQRTIPHEWKILMVTPISNPETPNFISKVDLKGKYKWLDAKTPAMGIRFIAENYDGIELLEFPTLTEYEKKLSKGYDVVGISFLTIQMEMVKQMVDLARKYDVKEVWGGGWGIDTPGARAMFDRSFAGHGEQLLYPILFNRWKDHLRHPVLIGPTTFFKKQMKIGYLYTIRGCKYRCDYCPSPSYVPDLLTMPLKEIEHILDIYAKQKVAAVVIFDETFLQDPQHSKHIVDMLYQRGLLWFCLTSSRELGGNVSKLREKGFLGCLMGIESLRDEILVDHKRGRLTSLNMRVLNELKDNSCYVVGTYIFCHEKDTMKSMREDIEKLASLEIPSIMPCILTPYPPTPMFEKYQDRIIDWDWKHWDDGHLVWRHPEITPAEAREILYECSSKCNSLSYNIKFIVKESLHNVIPFKIKSMIRRQLSPSFYSTNYQLHHDESQINVGGFP